MPQLQQSYAHRAQDDAHVHICMADGFFNVAPPSALGVLSTVTKRGLHYQMHEGQFPFVLLLSRDACFTKGGDVLSRNGTRACRPTLSARRSPVAGRGAHGSVTEPGAPTG